jgi:hypothetical protein
MACLEGRKAVFEIVSRLCVPRRLAEKADMGFPAASGRGSACGLSEHGYRLKSKVRAEVIHGRIRKGSDDHRGVERYRESGGVPLC